jgi:outer membrane protein assembly factor BamB
MVLSKVQSWRSGGFFAATHLTLAGTIPSLDNRIQVIMSIIPRTKGIRTMKINRFFVVLSILLLGIILTSCSTGATATNSWGGVTASDSAVYVSNGTSILALKADSGSVTWTYPEKAAASRLFYAAPAIAGDQLIVGDYAGKLVSLGLRDGKELWSFDGAKGHYVYAPLVANNMIIAQNADSKIYALDFDGKSVWTFTAGHGFWGTPVSDGTTVFAPCLDHYLYALNLTDGQLKWKADLGGPLVSSPLLSADGVLYLGTLDKTIVALNAADGTVLWKQKTTSGVWSTPVVLDDQLYVGDESGNISILKIADGSIVKSVDLKSSVISSGAAINGTLVFGDENGEIISIDKTGKHVVLSTLSGKIYSNLVSSKDQLYVLLTGGTKVLVTLDNNGNEIWNYTASK